MKFFLCCFRVMETLSHFYLYNTVGYINSYNQCGNQLSNMHEIFIASDIKILFLGIHSKQLDIHRGTTYNSSKLKST